MHWKHFKRFSRHLFGNNNNINNNNTNNKNENKNNINNNNNNNKNNNDSSSNNNNKNNNDNTSSNYALITFLGSGLSNMSCLVLNRRAHSGLFAERAPWD